MGFNGDLYPTSGATSVLTTKGDIVRYNTERERYGIGSAGQVLQVASSLPTWSTINLADSVLTTQGDVLYEGASALARLGQSTNNYTLATKGAGANPAWQASSTSVLTTTGDLLYASGANTLARLAGGTSGDVLTANGAGVAPSYQTPAGGGGAWTLEGNSSETNSGNLSVSGLSDKNVYQVQYNFSPVSGTTSCGTAIQFNGETASSYRGFIMGVSWNGTVDGEADNAQAWGIVGNEGHTKTCMGWINVYPERSYATPTSGNGVIYRGCESVSADGHGLDRVTASGGGKESISGAITSIELLMSNSINCTGVMAVWSQDWDL